MVRAALVDLQLLVFALLQYLVTTSKNGGTIFLSTESRDGALRLIIREPELNFSQEQIDRLFDAAQRDDSPVPELGLFVAQDLADGVGGCLEISDGGGGGLTFTVTLPLAEEPPAPPPEAETKDAEAQA